MQNDDARLNQAFDEFFEDPDNHEDIAAFIVENENTGTKFIVTLKSVLECIRCAEVQDEVPALDPEWWDQIKKIYPDLAYPETKAPQGGTNGIWANEGSSYYGEQE